MPASSEAARQRECKHLAVPARHVCLGAEILVAYARSLRLSRRRDLPSTLRALRSPRRTLPPCPQAESISTGRRLGRAVVLVLRCVPTDSRCLMRSLTLTALLARRGVATELVIAVAGPERFAAHAWVVHEGQPLLDPGSTEFRELVRL
jgi:hypothetical protein